VRRSASYSWAGALGVVAVGIAVSFLGFTSLSAWEGSCSACHAGEISRLSLGGHASVSCRDCHRGGTVADVIDFRLRLAAMAPAKLGASYRPLPAMPSDRCLSCHEAVLEKVVVAQGIRMNHRATHNAGHACVDCHASIIHDSPMLPGVAMDECLRCHVVSALSQDCDTCHVGPVRREARLRSGSFALVHGPAWQSSHGAGDLSTCSACHTAARCESCHGIAVPHADRWLNEHGPASRVADCSQCHETRFCDECHKLPMPHPEGFLGAHSQDTGEAGTAACHYCHDEGSCEQCHASHTHPGLDQERIRRLRTKAGLDVE